MLARLADASGFHMPIRGILCLLVNAILGHPDAKGRVIRPQKGIEQVVAKPAYRAALHRTLFGEHLTSATRHRREVYRFLSLLQVGLETSNDLDELLVFGACDDELNEQYRSIVCADPCSQRNPHFEAMCRTYIRGDLGADEMQLFLQELASERRRLFLTASEDELDKLGLWDTTVFHHAGRYLSELLEPLHQGRTTSLDLTRRIVAGLNRIWTGLLLADRADELYLCTGLDRTTATQSDILRQQIDVFGTDGSAVRISLAKNSLYPQVEIECRERVFRFDLTLGRFEFLCRVAEGAMPNTFSREYAEDFSMLKQRCLAQVCPPVRANIINGIRITSSGRIERVPIHLAEGVDG